jgi:hypothetical protein
MFIMEWLLESTTICILFDRGTVKVSSRNSTSQFSWSSTCTPEWASAKPLDCSSRTDEVGWSGPPRLPDLYHMIPVYGDTGFSVCATSAQRLRRIETAHFGGGCLCYSGHARTSVAKHGEQNWRLQCDTGAYIEGLSQFLCLTRSVSLYLQMAIPV